MVGWDGGRVCGVWVVPCVSNLMYGGLMELVPFRQQRLLKIRRLLLGGGKCGMIAFFMFFRALVLVGLVSINPYSLKLGFRSLDSNIVPFRWCYSRELCALFSVCSLVNFVMVNCPYTWFGCFGTWCLRG